MTVESFDLNQLITVTPSAAKHFSEQVARKNAKAIRLGLKEAGCTGFKYVIEEIEEPSATDHEIKLENNVTIYVDGEHLAAFQGIVIDYKVEGLNKSLVLNNPNVKEACGCGESVSF